MSPYISNVAVHSGENRPLDSTATRKMMQPAPLSNYLEKLKWVIQAFANFHNGILITDAEGTIVDINPSFTSITGYERDDIIGKTPKVLNSGIHDDAFYRAMWQSLRQQGSWQGEVSNRRKDGEIVVELLAIHAIRNEEGRITHYVGDFSDLTRLKAYQNQLELAAHHDALTQLPNRVLLTDRIRQAIAWIQRQGSLIALCCMDINAFQAINSRYGYAIGDAVLVEIAARLKKSIREGDTVARLESDKFVVLLSDVDSLQEVEQILARITALLAEPMSQLDGHCLATSIGLTLYPLDSSIPEQLLDHADQARRMAKQQCADSWQTAHYLFDPEQDAVSVDPQDGVPLLREALNEGQFQLHYQPILDLKSSRIDGLEASLRWQHPQLGLISPEEIRSGLLDKLENSPLAIEFDLWAIETALAQMAAWEKIGIFHPVSLNISMRLLRWSGFQSHLTDLIGRHPITASLRLELDMDDNAPLSDLTLTSRIIDECSKLGVNFVLDNFGTAYSSLTYLKYLPAQLLKIDPSLVRGMLSDPGDMAMVESILGLAKAFNRKVIAEGVGTTAQAEALWSRGCYSAQGYGIAAPMPAAAVADWFAHFQLPADWSRAQS